jgi:hypothetical protein
MRNWRGSIDVAPHVAASVDRNAQCERFLTTLFADTPSDAFIELRVRTGERMARAFYQAADVAAVSQEVARHAQRSDVYFGILPRTRRGGTRDDVSPHVRVLWADCDTAESVAALAEFVPTPAITVASGSGENRHAYWLLRDAVSLDLAEAANRRLASLLGADPHCTDAARNLRPPSLNHKHDPPTEVRLLDCDASLRYDVEEIVGALTDEAPMTRTPIARHDTDDPLLRIEPRHYVEQLTGLRVGRNSKVSCPFHQDRTPSLHVYRDPSRGWHCYGCGRGGSVYDLAGLLWLSGQSLDAPLRGRHFVEVRQRLLAMFLGDDAAA